MSFNLSLLYEAIVWSAVNAHTSYRSSSSPVNNLHAVSIYNSGSMVHSMRFLRKKDIYEDAAYKGIYMLKVLRPYIS